MRHRLTSLVLATVILGTACTPALYKRDVEARITGPTTLATGATAQLETVITYSDSSSPTTGPTAATFVAWQSSDTEVATVSASGLLTARAPGTVTITATPSGGTGTGRLIAGTLKVTITP